MDTTETDDRIAIIATAGRFPGARNVDELWTLLRDGVEARLPLSDDRLKAAGVPDELIRSPRYIKSCMFLAGANDFDAPFFGYSPNQAASIDPQHRIFLECAAEALECAGYGQPQEALSVGVFGGCGFNGHLISNLMSDKAKSPSEALQSLFDADKDFLTSRVSYKLGLTGPSITVQTACSTSLVAVHLACRSLLDYECDIALAGGSTILPQGRGDLYVDGGILSPDGHCRAFDAAANGVTFGSGAAIVVLRRLTDAIAAGDPIDAVIRSSAVNNDGSRKVGFTAPGLHSQIQVLKTALALADLAPQDIGMIEAHGTGTPLGDAIELDALTQVYSAGQSPRSCALGSIKTNIGHLDTAAGVAGLIKAVLCLKHRQFVPTVNFVRPNALLEAKDCPFYVSSHFRSWPAPASGVRRAGISSFGIGGTNAHVILEEAPSMDKRPETSEPHIFPLSARDPRALRRIALNLAECIEQRQIGDLGDVAYTLQAGRRRFDYRKILVAADSKSLVESLRATASEKLDTVARTASGASIVFMFPGQGVQPAGAATELYRTEGSFKADVDHCAALFSKSLGFDIRRIICASAEAAAQTHDIMFAQPAIFAIEYCIARLLQRLGIRPATLIGHSFGEYAAACTAGMLSVEGGVQLVSVRSQAIAGLSPGAMLAVSLPEERVRELMPSRLSVAAINAADQCVVSGDPAAVRDFASLLHTHGIDHQRLQTSHAFHSPAMAPAAARLREAAIRVQMTAPQLPFMSGVTGKLATEELVTSPTYWSDHLLMPVRFAAALGELARDQETLFVDIGPGQVLAGLARRDLGRHRSASVFSCMASAGVTTRSDLLRTIGAIWMQGGDIHWRGLHEGHRRGRVALPTYPFLRQPCLAAEDARAAISRRVAEVAAEGADKWLYVPSWRKSAPREEFLSSEEGGGWVVLADATGFGARLVAQLRRTGQSVAQVDMATDYSELATDCFAINPRRPDDYLRVVARLRDKGWAIRRVLHCWSLTQGPDEPPPDSCWSTQCSDTLGLGLLFLARALDAIKPGRKAEVVVIANLSQDVFGAEPVDIRKAAVLAVGNALRQEDAFARCVAVDLPVPSPTLSLIRQYEPHIGRLLTEADCPGNHSQLAYRGASRFVRTYEPAGHDWIRIRGGAIRDGGFYAITGGTGQLGLALAERLARRNKARLLLITRPQLSARANDPSNFPYESKEADELNRRVAAMEEAGACVLIRSADITDPVAVASVLEAAERKWGSLRGIFHLAGDLRHPSFRCPALKLEPEDFVIQLRPKVDGLRSLMSATAGRDLDFGVAFSSNAAVLGGLCMAAYAAANSVMDSAVTNRPGGAGPWITINWDGWYGGGAGDEARWGNSNVDPYALTVEQGLDTLWHVISSCAAPQVVISASQLGPRLTTWLQQTGPVASGASAPAMANGPNVDLEAAPLSHLESAIIGVWKEVLGTMPISINDHFLDLGGDSLIALRIVSRLKDLFGVDVPVSLLVGAEATVAATAKQIERATAARGTSAVLEQTSDVEP